MVNQILFPRSDDVAWYLDSMETIGSQGLVVKKVFTYFLTPNKSGEIKLPDIQFCYFDPGKKAYQYSTEQIPVFAVKEGANKDKNQAVSDQKPGLSMEQGALEIRLNKRSLLVAGQVILKFLGVLLGGVLVIWLLFLIVRWRSLPMIRVKKKLAALDKAKNKSDQDFIREAYFLLSDIIKIKYRLSLAGATRKKIRALIPDNDTARFTIDLVARYEELQYAKTALTVEERRAFIRSIKRVV